MTTKALRSHLEELLNALRLVDQAENGPWDGAEQERYRAHALAAVRKVLDIHADAGVSGPTEQPTPRTNEIALSYIWDDPWNGIVNSQLRERIDAIFSHARKLQREHAELVEALRAVIESCRSSGKRDGWTGSLRCPNPVVDGPKFAHAEALLSKLDA